MHTLQDLGEKLAELAPAKLLQLGLPETLVIAINDYRRFNKWEARRRQMQYIGRLMRDIDSAPIAATLDVWSQGTRAIVASFHTVETWRDRLLADPLALAALIAEYPNADQPRIIGLISRTHAERDGGRPPASSRLLFRELSKLMDRKEDAGA